MKSERELLCLQTRWKPADLRDELWESAVGIHCGKGRDLKGMGMSKEVFQAVQLAKVVLGVYCSQGI